MADRKHKETLHRGVAEWNAWRRENPRIVPDLSGANIRVKDLAGVDFRGANLGGALLTGADLEGADLAGANLSHADLMAVNLHRACLKDADLTRANLMDANLKDADLAGACLEGAILYRADLKGADCVCNCLWFNMLMDFAGGVQAVDGSDRGFYFEDVGDSFIENSFVATQNSRLEITLSDPVSTQATYEILGALNRLYREVSDEELIGPIIKIGLGEDAGRPVGEDREDGA
jgi:hypothetical protein